MWLARILVHLLFFFFFQAEDGIRDVAVTGVQTCALPICATNRLATFRQPIRSMQPTAHSRTVNGFFTFCARSSESVLGATSSATGAFRFCKCNPYCTVSTWLRAFARLTSGLKRATTRLK